MSSPPFEEKFPLTFDNAQKNEETPAGQSDVTATGSYRPKRGDAGRGGPVTTNGGHVTVLCNGGKQAPRTYYAQLSSTSIHSIPLDQQMSLPIATNENDSKLLKSRYPRQAHTPYLDSIRQ